MTRLARIIAVSLVEKFGPEEMVKRLADPVWFQSFGSILVFDWNASGLTTTTLGPLKAALFGLKKDLEYLLLVVKEELHEKLLIK